MLWGRGFDPTFSLFILGDKPVHLPIVGDLALGHIYEFVKDVTASLVVLGALVFVYFRVIKHERRMTLSGEGVLSLSVRLHGIRLGRAVPGEAEDREYDIADQDGEEELLVHRPAGPAGGATTPRSR